MSGPQISGREPPLATDQAPPAGLPAFTMMGILRPLFVFAVAVLFPALIYLKSPGFEPFSASEITILFVLLTFAALSVMVRKERVGQYTDPLLALLLICFVCYQGGLLFFSGSAGAAAASVLLHDKYMVLALLVPVFVRSNVDEKRLLQLLVAVATFTVYLSAIRVIRDPSLIIDLVVGGSFARDSSLFPNPNMYAVYLAAAVSLAFAYATYVSSRTALLLGIAGVLAPTLVVLILTFSRRAWLLVLLFLLGYLLFKRGARVSLFVLASLLLTILVVYIDPAAVFQRFALIFDTTYASNAARVSEFQTQLRFILNDPLVLIGGAGPGMAGPASAFADRPQRIVFHNYFMLLVMEYGLTALVLYLAIFVRVMFLATRRLYAGWLPVAEHNRLLIYAVTLAALYAAGVVGSTAIAFPTSMLQWILVGLIMRIVLEDRPSAVTPTMPQ